jgi:hypothetical protein
MNRGNSNNYLLVNETGSNEAEHRRQLAKGVNLALQGKLNAVTTLTLTPSSATTTIQDDRITALSYIGLQPKTANAAAALSSLYTSAQTNGSATFTHANDANVDKTFNVVVIG